MSGLAELIPYFECQYPQVAPLSVGQLVNSGGVPGLADYIDPFPFPIPQYLKPGNIRGLGCPDCGGSCGLGDGSISIGSLNIPVTAPGGYFATGDFTQWGAAEWASVSAAVYFAMSLIGDTKRGYQKARKFHRRRSGK